MRRLSDFREPGLELVFFDNNRLERLEFAREFAREDQVSLCLETARAFAELWRPDAFTVGLAALEHGGPGDPRRELTVESAPDRPVLDGVKPGQAEIFASIQTSVRGWNRIALPDGATAGEWSAVCADGLYPRAVRVREAPPLHGRPTLWVRPEEALPASHFSLQVYSLDDAELRTMLGPSFFLPANDPRPADYLVRGRALSEWQAVNVAIYDRTMERLAALGWTRP